MTGLVLASDRLRWSGGVPVVHARCGDRDRVVCGECGCIMAARERGDMLVLDASNLEPHRAIGCRSHVLAGAPAGATAG